jgi:hypothetical protein
MELRRALADAAALDVMGAGRPAGQHCGLGRLDDGPVQSGQGGG